MEKFIEKFVEGNRLQKDEELGLPYPVIMLANADLHIHSPYSIAVSRFMQPERLLAGCVTKGIDVLGTGDALQPWWHDEWNRTWRMMRELLSSLRRIRGPEPCPPPGPGRRLRPVQPAPRPAGGKV